MPAYCCAYGCTNNSAADSDISFHAFPLKNTDLTKEWLSKIKRRNFKPTTYTKICSEHFESDCFEPERYTTRKRLKPDAIPTKFCFTKENNRSRKSHHVEYHPALSPLSWLFGTWESVDAEVSYPTMTSLEYSEVMEFQPTMQPLLEYKSETWDLDFSRKMHCEKGFLRIDPESGKIALLVSHNFGLTEVSEGFVENKSLSLESISISRMSFTKSAATVKIVRELDMRGEELFSTVFMETTSQPLQKHLHCRYKKKEEDK